MCHDARMHCVLVKHPDALPQPVVSWSLPQLRGIVQHARHMASLKVEFAKTLEDADKVEFLRDLWTINISEDESVMPFPSGHFAP